MIPILYESTETAFVSNGLCRLYDTIEAVVSEERNGIYELDFTYPIDGANFNQIKCGRIVGVTHDDSGDIQPFDIVSYSRPISGIVSFHAVHVSYRLNGVTIKGEQGAIYSLTDALTFLDVNVTPSDNPFVYETDFDANGYLAAYDNTPRTVRQMLGGIEGSIIDTYGGEMLFDKFRVIIKKNRGVTRDIVVRYGVNMVEFVDDTDFSETYKTVIPYWKGQSATGEPDIVKGSPVDSGTQSYNGRNVTVPLDLSEKFESKPTVGQVEAEAAAYLAAHEPTIPSQTIKVDFLRLQDYGYEGLADLLRCGLCDRISVEFPRYNMRGYFKIVKTAWNVLDGRYEGMELGQLSTSLSEALGLTSSLGNISSSGDVDNLTVNNNLFVGGTTTLGGDPTSAMEAATKQYVDASVPSFNSPTGVAWSSVSSNWTPSLDGLAVTRINPSNTSNAYLVIQDTSNSNTIVAQVSTTSGMGQSVTWPVISGHTYKVSSHSTNVTSQDTRLYNFV